MAASDAVPRSETVASRRATLLYASCSRDMSKNCIQEIHFSVNEHDPPTRDFWKISIHWTLASPLAFYSLLRPNLIRVPIETLPSLYWVRIC